MATQSSDISKFFRKALLLVLPIVALYGAELFVLPSDFFTYRAWESITVKHFNTCLPGPFYPNVNLERVELGDLAYRTAAAVKKPVTWQTDRFGFRNPETPGNYEIVVIGDSVAAGCSLSQDDLLSGKLTQAVGRRTYLYAPATLNEYLGDVRFIGTTLPKLVIFEQIERELGTLPAVKEEKKHCAFNFGPEKLDFTSFISTPLFSRLMVLSDRAWSLASYNYLASRISELAGKSRRYPELGGIFFFQGSEENRPRTAEEIRAIADRIASYRDELAARGSQFLFVPIPNKETYFYELFQDKVEPNLLRDLKPELAARHVEFIDVASAFAEYRARHPNADHPYHVDDTHWNQTGVGIVEKLVEAWVKDHIHD